MQLLITDDRNHKCLLEWGYLLANAGLKSYPLIPSEDIDDIYCVMVNLTLNTGLSLVSKKAIKAKIK